MTLNYHRNPAEVNWEILINDLIADDFHNGRTVAQLRASFENSQVQAYAMVGDRCIGTARALSDGIGNAYVIDVWTQSTYRNQGIARTMMEMLLEKVAGQHVYLQTDDAVEFYRKLGFSEQPSGMSLIVGEYLTGGANASQ
ncbi:MAG: GNAT family N-acetyltransferase [Pseudomonadales bacterium]|nr:GNAT family N-acetyltransferase [Pseudomonadales bacterium]